MYLDHKVDVWFNRLMMQRNKISWVEFCEEVCKRFGDREFTDEVEEFKNLFRTALMLQRNPLLPEHYFVSIFISGLKDELRPMVKMFKAMTLAKAIEQAKLQELPCETLFKKTKSLSRTNTNTTFQHLSSSATTSAHTKPQNN